MDFERFRDENVSAIRCSKSVRTTFILGESMLCHVEDFNLRKNVFYSLIRIEISELWWINNIWLESVYAF